MMVEELVALMAQHLVETTVGMLVEMKAELKVFLMAVRLVVDWVSSKVDWWVWKKAATMADAMA